MFCNVLTIVYYQFHLLHPCLSCVDLYPWSFHQGSHLIHLRETKLQKHLSIDVCVYLIKEKICLCLYLKFSSWFEYFSVDSIIFKEKETLKWVDVFLNIFSISKISAGLHIWVLKNFKIYFLANLILNKKQWWHLSWF